MSSGDVQVRRLADPQTPSSEHLPRGGWHWLALAALLGLFVGGPQTIGLAVWLQGILLLRFLRRNPDWRGFGAAWLAASLSGFVVGRGFIPLPDLALAPFMLVAGLSGLLPYLADRLLARRVGGLWATLVLPCATVAWGFLDAMQLNPYGSWGNPVYTQAESGALLQLAALAGPWALSFLIAWMAALVNWAWERGFAPATLAGGLRLGGAVLLVAILGGGARMALTAPVGAPVAVAAVVPSSQLLYDAVPLDTLGAIVGGTQPTAAQRAALSAGVGTLSEQLFAESTRAARAGARIVVWPEGSLLLLPGDEAAVQARAAALARREGIYLATAYAVFHPGALHENKAVVFDPQGSAALTYHKAKLVPFAEDGRFVRGPAALPTLDTPYGRLALVICHDQDHHEYIAQAGRQGVDILLVPTGDWAAIGRAHHHLGVFRAVEQGLTVLRAARGGLPALIDPYGRTLAMIDQADMNFDGSPAGPSREATVSLLIGRASTSGVWTPYQTIGDSFAWACVAGLVGLALQGALAGLNRQRRAALA